jgi:hypothetical protein
MHTRADPVDARGRMWAEPVETRGCMWAEPVEAPTHAIHQDGE